MDMTINDMVKSIAENSDCNCSELDQDIEGYTCYKCYEEGK